MKTYFTILMNEVLGLILNALKQKRLSPEG